MSSPHEARTTTFLMTDIEGSTRLWEERPGAMAAALEAHDSLLREAVERADGTVVKTTGDGVLAAFETPDRAVNAAIEAQLALARNDWPEIGSLRVRMAIHAGGAESREGDFHGPTLNRVARLLAIGHGGQVLVSGAAAALVADSLPAGAGLGDRGEHHLRDLDRSEHVFQLTAPGLAREFPALRSTTPETNLPVPLTSFIGRQPELDEVRRLLLEHRLVSLVGVGGTGKTRLMLRVADDLLDRHANGVWLVELAPIREPGLIAQEVARALGIPDASGQPPIGVVTDFLRDKDLLLLLDNCEHLIEGAADLVQRLLGKCQSLRVMATSREALGVAGETTYPVPSLGVPDEPDRPNDHGPLDAPGVDAVAATEAVRLFVDRAAAILPGFQLDPTTVGPVAEICRRLDGIPLAIELAAARVNVLSVAEIAHGLGDRFRLLTGGRRTSVPRQQTLQALIDWSWNLLAEPDQRLLRRLSVFAGGWTLEAAALVTSAGAGGAADSHMATLDGLSRLVDRSLVVVDHAGSTRYRMLETIRQYARDRLVASGEVAAVRAAHLTVFKRLALEAAAYLEGPDLVTWLDRLDAEIDNLRAALDWAHETDVGAALEMSIAMGQYWRYRSVGTEGVERLQQAVDALGTLSEPGPAMNRERASLVARVLATAAMASAIRSGRTAEAPGWADEAVRLARESGDERVLSFALGTRAFTYMFGSRASFEEVIVSSEEMVGLAEAQGAWSLLAGLAAGIAMHATISNPADAAAWLERASDAAHRSGSPWAIAFSALARGRVLSYRGNLDESRPWFAEALEWSRRLGDQRQELVVRSDLAHALRRGGSLVQAEAEYRETIVEWQHLGERGAVANQLESFGYLASELGRPQRAAVLLGAAERLREEAGAKMLPVERAEYDSQLMMVRKALDTPEFEHAWAEGQAISTDDAVALARSP